MSGTGVVGFKSIGLAWTSVIGGQRNAIECVSRGLGGKCGCWG